MLLVAESRTGRFYRPWRVGVDRHNGYAVNSYYVRAAPSVAKSLLKRLAAKGRHIRTDEAVELAAARDALAGRAVLFVRYMRGKDPFTGERWELRSYRALPLEYKLREIKKKPGYTT